MDILNTTLGHYFAGTSDRLHRDTEQEPDRWRVRNQWGEGVVEHQEHNSGPVELVQDHRIGRQPAILRWPTVVSLRQPCVGCPPPSCEPSILYEFL